MKVTSLDNIPGMAIFIDFKKAFDSVDWNFLAKVLEAFNFGPQIQKWIKTFYTDISSCVINNGQFGVFLICKEGFDKVFLYPVFYCFMRGNFSSGS